MTAPVQELSSPSDRLGVIPRGGSIEDLRKNNVMPVLRVILAGIWDRRPIVLRGESQKQESSLWKALAQVQDRQGFEDWLLLARKAAWGSHLPWSQQVEGLDLQQQREAKRKASKILGAPLAKWLSEDEGWKSWWIAADAQLQDDDRLDRRSMALDQQRQNARIAPRSPYPPIEQYQREALYEKAERIGERFGLRKIEAAAGMPLWCIAEQLNQAEVGLAQLAKALGWEESQIGNNHLGLGWELAPEDQAACYDPLQHMIYLGREEGAGSFAHEFAHALDRVAAKPSSRDPYLSIQQANDPYKDDIVLTPLENVRARMSVVLGFQDAYHTLRKSTPATDAALNALDNDIERWIQNTLTPSKFNPRQKQMWNHWRSRVTIALTGPFKSYAARYDRLLDMAEEMWSQPIQDEGWLSWAKARDKMDKRNYWAEPHEVFARAFHAVVRERIGRDGWAAGPATQNDLFPCGVDLQNWDLKIQQQWHPIEQAWNEKKPLKLNHHIRAVA